MGNGDSDEKKALKSNILDLVTHSSGLRRTGYHASELANLLEGYTETEVRDAAKDLSNSHSWASFSGDYITVSNKNKSKERIKELRREIYELD